MFQGILVFAVGGIVLVGAYLVVIGKRRAYEETEPEADRLSDEDFRRIEFGDEDI